MVALRFRPVARAGAATCFSGCEDAEPEGEAGGAVVAGAGATGAGVIGATGGGGGGMDGAGGGGGANMGAGAAG